MALKEELIRKLKAKWPSRKTIARMSKDDVLAKIEAMGIDVPKVEAKPKRRFYDDVYDEQFLAPTIEEQEFYARQKLEKEAWLLESVKDAAPEQDKANREALFMENIRRVCERAGLGELNEMIDRRLRDAENLPAGCTIWSLWLRRTATRLVREKACQAILSAEDREHP